MKFDIVLLILTSIVLVSHQVIAAPVDPAAQSAGATASAQSTLTRLNAIRRKPVNSGQAVAGSNANSQNSQDNLAANNVQSSGQVAGQQSNQGDLAASNSQNTGTTLTRLNAIRRKPVNSGQAVAGSTGNTQYSQDTLASNNGQSSGQAAALVAGQVAGQQAGTDATNSQNSGTTLTRLNAIRRKPVSSGQAVASTANSVRYSSLTAQQFEYLRYIAAAHVNYYLKLNYNAKQLAALVPTTTASTSTLSRVKGMFSRTSSKSATTTTAAASSNGKRGLFLSSSSKGTTNQATTASTGTGLFGLSIAQSILKYGLKTVDLVNPLGYSIPAPVDYLFLKLRTLKLTEGVFRLAGNLKTLSTIVSQLNAQPANAKTIINAIPDAISVSIILKRFIGQLADPVMTTQLEKLWATVSTSSNTAAVIELAQMLPKQNHDLLAVILRNMNWAAQDTSVTKMDVSSYAKVMGPNMFSKTSLADLPAVLAQNKVVEVLFKNANLLDFVPATIVARYNRLKATFEKNGVSLTPVKIITLVMADVVKSPPGSIAQQTSNPVASKAASTASTSAQKKST